MAKTKYVATFTDGETLTRSTDRTYSHAWRVRYIRTARSPAGHGPGQGVEKGFSRTEDLARAQAATIENQLKRCAWVDGNSVSGEIAPTRAA